VIPGRADCGGCVSHGRLIKSTARQGLTEATVEHAHGRFLAHLETCVADGVRAGKAYQLVNELMDALKFDRSITRPNSNDAQ
jgi:hypothetical protein